MAGTPPRSEQPHQRDDGECVEAEHRRLHRRQVLAEARHEVEHDLVERRIDRARVVLAVDLRVDVGVTQIREGHIGGQVTVGVDARRLDAPVPDVAVDVGRDRVDGQHHHAQDRRDHQDAAHRARHRRRLPALVEQDHDDGGEVDRHLDPHVAVDRVIVVHAEPAGEDRVDDDERQRERDEPHQGAAAHAPAVPGGERGGTRGPIAAAFVSGRGEVSATPSTRQLRSPGASCPVRAT